jgi:hypothetical protein
MALAFDRMQLKIFSQSEKQNQREKKHTLHFLNP